ncbi:MAG: polysaccharide biosynthesis protein [Lachnospiraceae bacterium]|nr:polysaccharide biosynthesis protein [Lachnospiraceae bacterium]
MKSHFQNALIKGTLILTLSGLITRFMGFFYKIYLSRLLSADQLGIYQLIFPVYAICFTLFGSGIQTAISQLVAKYRSDKTKQQHILLTGLFLSLCVASLLSILVFFWCEPVSAYLLMEKRTKHPLKVLSFAFLFCSISSCLNGYYYGNKQTSLPASTTLVEQTARILFVFLLPQKLSAFHAVWGIVFGEGLSALYSLFYFLHFTKQIKTTGFAVERIFFSLQSHIRPVLKLSLPLSANRFVVSLLNSIEAVLIPFLLKDFGLNSKEALSVYGIFTGMAMPFILFPSALPSSLSVLLLPTVSEASARKEESHIRTLSEKTLHFCLLIGIFSTSLFFFYGFDFGQLFFHNDSAGMFLRTLSFLCPFMYLSITVSSIINGLGFNHITFFHTCIGLTLRIVLIMFLIPSNGIYGYLISLLVSHLTICFLNYHFLKRKMQFSVSTKKSILYPTLFSLLIGSASRVMLLSIHNLYISLGLFLVGTLAVCGSLLSDSIWN